MSNSLTKGQTQKVNARFKGGIVFDTPPRWVLYDWESDPIQQGIAVDEGGHVWSAQITIPTTLIIPSGEQEIYVEFVGTDVNGKQWTHTKDLTVIDVAEDWRSYGILWYKSPSTLSQTAIFAKEPKSITVEVKNGFGVGKTLFETTILNPTSIGKSSGGFVYDVDLPNVSLTAASGGWYPHQLFITAEFDSGAPDVTVKPIYTMTAYTLTHLTALKRFLDKARLEEIDRNIGWEDEELIHYLLEGAKYINSIGESTYWTAESMPSTLHTHMVMAAAMIGLNARYLAEGFTEFDFQGANSQLNVNRRDTISYKIDEINNFLDNKLPKAKAEAIRNNGPGTPPEGAVAGKKQLGTLGIQFGPMTNRASWFRQGNYYR